MVNLLLHPALMISSGVLRLGPLRLSVYGLSAAVGMIAALSVSQWTAQLAGIRSPDLWDAGWFAVTAAFVISRLLLIVRDPHAFATLPLVVLALPSFTYGDIVLTTLAVLAYVRRKRMPLLAIMDAWAPCAALLACALSLGHSFEGTDVGMPTSLPWGIHAPGAGRVQPVQLFGFAGSLILFVVLMRLLQRRLLVGTVATIALLSGGAMAFLLDMIAQPTEWGGSALLDPGQWVAVGAMALGAWIFMRMHTFSKEPV